MDSNIGRLSAILDYLGEEFTVKDFDHRLRLQKLIYLVQLTKIDLGYRFSWYVHGPYSSELTKTAYAYYENRSHFDRFGTKFRINEAGKVKLRRIKKLAEPPNGIGDRSRWLELLASVHYLRHIAYTDRPKNEIDQESILQELMVEKADKNFRQEEIDLAWKVLDSNGLIENKLFTT